MAQSAKHLSLANKKLQDRSENNKFQTYNSKQIKTHYGEIYNLCYQVLPICTLCGCDHRFLFFNELMPLYLDNPQKVIKVSENIESLESF